jgi:hypothetical protein
VLRQNLLLFRLTSIGKILDNYRARLNSKNQLMQTKRRLQGHASKQAQLKKQEDKAALKASKSYAGQAR